MRSQGTMISMELEVQHEGFTDMHDLDPRYMDLPGADVTIGLADLLDGRIIRTSGHRRDPHRVTYVSPIQ